MPHPTTTARWSNIVVVTWAVPAGAVARYIPPSAPNPPIEVDVFGKGPLVLADGRPAAAVSLIARQASHQRILGVRWPGLARGASLSLVICVKQGIQRGVVVVREVVPSRTVAWLLRRWYNQPAVTAPIQDEVKQQTLLIGAEYRVAWPVGGLAPASYVSKEMEVGEHMVRVVGHKPANRPGAGSLEAWLMERPFVFGLDAQGHPLVYEVIHPMWGVHPAMDSEVRMDIGSIFGADLGFLAGLTPVHTMLCAGSEAAVFPRRGSVGVRWGMRRAR